MRVLRNTQHARKMENHDLRLREEVVHSWILTFDATNVPLDGAIVLSVPFSGTAVKHGNCQFQFHPSSMT